MADDETSSVGSRFWNLGAPGTRRRLGNVLIASALTIAACSTDPAPTTTIEAAPAPTTAATTTTTLPTAGPKPVIVDYSPTVSDVGGFLYLLAHPDVEVIGVSLPTTGEAGCELGLDVTLGILALVGQDHVPVACDPEWPAGAAEWPEDFLAKQINLKFGLPRPETDADPRTAPELIVDLVSASEAPVTVWAVAPLTNVARALDHDPTIASNIAEIVIMGGAVDVTGNVFDSAAEWNLYIDAAATEAVVSSGLPVTLVALDATNDVPVPGWLQLALDRAEQSAEVEYLASMVKLFDTPGVGFYFMWDELAAAAVAESIELEVEEVAVTVTVGGPDSGATARDVGGSPVTLAKGVASPDAFYTDFISVLAGSEFEKQQATPEEEAYIVAVSDSLVPFGEALTATFANGSAFESDPYDGPTVAEAFRPIFDSLSVIIEVVEPLDPPASLSSQHIAFLEEARNDLAAQDAVLEAFASANSLDEAFGSLTGLSDGSACEALASEAFYLGVDVAFPCNP